MSHLSRHALVASMVLVLAGWVVAQAPNTPAAPETALPPRDAVAAKVNGQPVPEIDVYRALMRVPPAQREAARKDVLNYLIENKIVDQYLAQLKVEPDAKDIEKNLAAIKKEAEKEGGLEKVLSKIALTEDDLRREMSNSLRWEKFVLQQGTDKVLHELFDKNLDMFNGSRMQARHILIAAKDTQTAAAQIKLLELKKQIEAEAAAEVAKLPADADAITREKERTKVLDKAFADAASKESSCPSKARGGDLGYFPRVGSMVEPFARAAFALKPYEISAPVTTDFGVHLILALDKKPGKDVKYEDVLPFVKEVYGEKLREAIINQYRPRSNIVIEAKKD